ncbi:hypothetical protein N665_1633s0001 [Sinapis alba]|nr:hypothetical protein N665_1633s0001 [Sinapis alba]
MTFGTYMVLAGFSLGLYGKFSMFSLGALNWLFVKGMVGWLLQVMLPKIILLLLGSGETPLLDVVGIFLTFPLWIWLGNIGVNWLV